MNIEKFNRAKEIQDDLKQLKTAINIFNSELVLGLFYRYKDTPTFENCHLELPKDVIEDIKTMIISKIDKLENEFKSI